MKRSAWIVLATLALVGCKSPAQETREYLEKRAVEHERVAKIERQQKKIEVEKCLAKPEPKLGMDYQQLKASQGGYDIALVYIKKTENMTYSIYSAVSPCYHAEIHSRNGEIIKIIQTLHGAVSVEEKN